MSLRKVYAVKYEIGCHHLMIVYNPDDSAVLDFLIRSIRYCLHPKAYVRDIPMPSNDEIKSLEKRYGSVLNQTEFIRMLKIFNETNPNSSIVKAHTGTATRRDLLHFSASRYLQYRYKMARLKKEYKAHRINLLCKILKSDSVKTSGRHYDIATFTVFCWYVKSHYLSGRTFYAKC